jgi:tetratricopeptide (TPR) repeat protein
MPDIGIDESTAEARSAETGGSWTTRALIMAGVVVFAIFLVAGVVRLTVRAEGDSPTGPAAFWEFGVFVAAGLSGGGLLAGMGVLLRALREVRSSMIRVERFGYEQHDSAVGEAPGEASREGAAAPEGDSGLIEVAASRDGAWQEMVRLLRDIRDNSLLSEPERQEKRLHVAEEEILEAQATLRSLTEKGDFVRARELAQQVERRYPSDERAAGLAEQVEGARERRQSDDISRTSKEVGDLLSISAWPRAREVAGGLQARHPDAVEARHLLIRIEREYKLFQDEQRRRMYAEVQRYVTRRRWEEALAAARTFIERFPGGPEAEALRVQTPTLETNWEIEKRQKLEAQIMDLAKRGRYMEAVELARKVIARYPDSPQAEALRLRLDRLVELADDPGAPPARIRLDD